MQNDVVRYGGGVTFKLGNRLKIEFCRPKSSDDHDVMFLTTFNILFSVK